MRCRRERTGCARGEYRRAQPNHQTTRLPNTSQNSTEKALSRDRDPLARKQWCLSTPKFHEFDRMSEIEYRYEDIQLER